VPPKAPWVPWATAATRHGGPPPARRGERRHRGTAGTAPTRSAATGPLPPPPVRFLPRPKPAATPAPVPTPPWPRRTPRGEIVMFNRLGRGPAGADPRNPRDAGRHGHAGTLGSDGPAGTRRDRRAAWAPAAGAGRPSRPCGRALGTAGGAEAQCGRGRAERFCYQPGAPDSERLDPDQGTGLGRPLTGGTSRSLPGARRPGTRTARDPDVPPATTRPWPLNQHPAAGTRPEGRALLFPWPPARGVNSPGGRVPADRAPSGRRDVLWPRLGPAVKLATAGPAACAWPAASVPTLVRVTGRRSVATARSASRWAVRRAALAGAAAVPCSRGAVNPGPRSNAGAVHPPGPSPGRGCAAMYLSPRASRAARPAWAGP